MIHHVSLGTNDLERARQFYDPVMSRLGLRLIKESERIVAYGLTEVLFSL
jgi:catechol 2,3-dioxygenase-like lactoylglutathione lyase family enzyme